MNQADIETFLMLVRTKNITKTAENLFVSQPTVSHRLKLLEEELGASLLIRKKGYKKVELTAKGEEFVPLAQRWLALMQETRSLKNARDEMHLNIGCTNTLNSSIFVDLYRRILRNTDTRIKLNISTHYSYEIYELLENHAVDAGFVYHDLHFKNIVVEPILQEKMFIVQNRDGALMKDKISVDELDPEREVAFMWETNYQVWHEQMISKGHRNYLEVDIYNLLQAFLEEKGRWAIAPLTVARQLLGEGNVHVCEIAGRPQPPQRVTYMIHHRDMSVSKKETLKIFVGTLQEHFRQYGLSGFSETEIL